MKKLLVVPAFLFAQSVLAQPFDNCPSHAFLTQGTMPQTFAVDLISGDYRIAADYMETSKPVNATGFNPVDQFIYGWSKEHNAPVRVHSDFTIEAVSYTHLTLPTKRIV